MPTLLPEPVRVQAAGSPPKLIDEYTVVLKGSLHVEHDGGELTVPEGRGVRVPAGERVRYATPDGPTEYVSVCLPAFSPERVHRAES